jgi:hypothetical protein
MDARSEKVIDLFARVCLDGEARFAKGDVSRVNAQSVPAPLGWEIFGTRGEFYRVMKPVEAWIAITAEPGDRSYSRICRVAARYVDIRGAANRVRAYLLEAPLPRGPRLGKYEEFYLDGGAKFEIWHARYHDLVVLESFVLAPDAAARARRKGRR